MFLPSIQERQFRLEGRVRIEKEFFLMQPSQSNASISDNWASVLDKLCKLLGFSEDQCWNGSRAGSSTQQRSPRHPNHRFSDAWLVSWKLQKYLKGHLQ
ncbi:hypothetical protein MAR_025550, partial [Mya arenaria]